MNLRDATALALTGWYLMVPPYVGNYRDLWAPVSQWKIVQGFDTASGCEAYLDLREDPEPLNPKFTKMRDMGIGLFALKYARCIFSYDPAPQAMNFRHAAALALQVSP